MKTVILLLAALVLCQAASIKERLATREEEATVQGESDQEARILECLMSGLWSAQECLTKSQEVTIPTECLQDMRGNKVCDEVCDFAEYKYDNGDCCKKRGFKYNGLSCVAKTNGYY